MIIATIFLHLTKNLQNSCSFMGNYIFEKYIINLTIKSKGEVYEAKEETK